MQLALRALKIAPVNLLIAIALLVPIELYFGSARIARFLAVSLSPVLCRKTER
jgi:hypothetical protein